VNVYDHSPNDLQTESVGMGKTIIIASLLHTSGDPEHVEQQCKIPEESMLDATSRPTHKAEATLALNTTLIVAPTSLMTQWAKELERSSKKGSIEILVWHGTNRNDLDSVLSNDKEVNVVITSYGVLGSEWTNYENRSRSGSALFQGE
jgi:DNA repair protein RAD5